MFEINSPPYWSDAVILYGGLRGIASFFDEELRDYWLKLHIVHLPIVFCYYNE